jgi:hypothetical protein
MATLSVLNTNKLSEYTTDLSDKRRRRAELHENELVQINTYMSQWLLGAISGDQTLMNTSLAGLADLYDSTITPPTNNVGAIVTASNSRRGTAISLSAGTNTITFSSAMTTATYSLTVYPYTSLGGNIQYSIAPASRTVNGFTIITASAGSLDYIALEN